MSYEKKANELDVVIRGSVERLRGNVSEVNLMLSGGIDSGVLAAISKPDRVITVKLPYGRRYDEFEFAETVVKHLGLEDRWVVIELDESKLDIAMETSVRAIGRPIPHFNIFPLYVAFDELAAMGITDVAVGDGPDESMCGYARHIIMEALYRPYEKALDNPNLSEYLPLIERARRLKEEGLSAARTYAELIGKDYRIVKELMAGFSLIDGMCKVDTILMRMDMMDMSQGIARHFGIKLHAPFEYSACDDYMFNLWPEYKIHLEAARGKELLRYVAKKYLPKDIAFRGHKIGGPLVPINRIKGWDDLEEFDKSRYMQWQRNILEGLV